MGKETRGLVGVVKGDAHGPLKTCRIYSKSHSDGSS